MKEAKPTLLPELIEQAANIVNTASEDYLIIAVEKRDDGTHGIGVNIAESEDGEDSLLLSAIVALMERHEIFRELFTLAFMRHAADSGMLGAQGTTPIETSNNN